MSSEGKPDGTQEPAAEPINLGDGAALKNALDEALQGIVEEDGFQEDNRWSNFQLFVGLLSVIAGACAHFLGGPYPQGKTALFWSIMAYMATSAISAGYAFLVQKDFFYLTIPRKTKTGSLIVKARSDLPRFSEKFTLELHASLDGASSWSVFRDTASVTQFFDSDGYLVKDNYSKFVKGLVQQTLNGAGKKND
eukprot:TRINITY_DN32866_c0_g1_i1.p1 TRINITY_DN32866_c0_g1~~TRINITY_DN32866_c0_g1_i1.p1  ORF type:complete len:194 (+),score=38.51 TRINITY_DN32866_c0_g1_i1:92-673(+)